MSTEKKISFTEFLGKLNPEHSQDFLEATVRSNGSMTHDVVCEKLHFRSWFTTAFPWHTSVKGYQFWQDLYQWYNRMYYK